MIINIDTDHIMSLFDCDFDTAATILADLDDQRDTVLDFFDNAILDRFGNNEWIRLAWCVDDVMGECPWLTRDQALEVLHDLKRNHDACIGINWDVIRDTAALKYPRPPMQKYQVTATIVVTVEAEDHEQAQLEAIDHFDWSNAYYEVEEINDVDE